jgi:broad specificity phosphatase PhoE
VAGRGNGGAGILGHWRAGWQRDSSEPGIAIGEGRSVQNERQKIRLVGAVPGMTARVRIVQHGEKERLPGDPGLTPAGRLQAAEVATYLEEVGSVTAAYSSPLHRARETAQPICERTGLVLQVDDRLQERMNWTGDKAQGLASFLDDWAKASSDRDFRPSSGVSSHVAGERFRQFLDSLAGDGTAVVVAPQSGRIGRADPSRTR